MIASFIIPVTFEVIEEVDVVVVTAVGVVVDVAFPPVDATTGGVAAGEATALLELVETTFDAVAFDTDKNSRGFEASANRRALRCPSLPLAPIIKSARIKTDFITIFLLLCLMCLYGIPYPRELLFTIISISC